MPVEQKYIDEARKQLRAQLEAKLLNASAEQIEAAYLKCLSNEAVENSMLYAGDIWPSTPIRVDELIDAALADSPELTTPDPGAAAVAEHLLEESIRVYGRERIGELRIDAFRRAEAMAPQERIATGVKAEPEGQTVSEGSTTKAVPLWERPYDWQGWHNELAVRVPQHPASLLPSERKRWIDEIKKDAKAAAKLPHASDVATLARIESKNPETLSAEDRITAARLRA